MILCISAYLGEKQKCYFNLIIFFVMAFDEHQKFFNKTNIFGSTCNVEKFVEI